MKSLSAQPQTTDARTSMALGAGVISIAALLFFLPFSEITFTRDLFFGVLVLGFLVWARTQRQRGLKMVSPHKPLAILIIASIIWGFVSLTNAVDPEYSLRAVIHKMAKPYFLYFMTFFLVGAFSVQQEKLKWVFYPLAAATLLMSAYGCYQFYLSPVLVANRVSGFTGAFYRLAVFLVMSIPIVVAVAFTSQGGLRWFFIFVALISVAALFFTFTRSAWLAVLVEGVVLMGIGGGFVKRAFLVVVLFVSLAFAAMSYHSVLPKQLVIHGPNSEHARMEAISRAIEIIGEHPWMGVGYGKKTFSMYAGDIYAQHAHNLFLNTAVEMGIPGMLLLGAIFFVVIKSFVQGLSNGMGDDKRLLLVGILASLIGFLTLNMFDYMYQGWPGQMLWLLIGVGYGLMQGEERVSALMPEPAPVVSKLA